MFDSTPVVMPLNDAARALRVPARWLRGEVEAGRIPALQAGGRFLIHVPTARDLLSERARAERAEGGES